MITRTRFGFRHVTIPLLLALGLCLAGGLLLVMQAQAGSRDARPAAHFAKAPAPGASYVAGEVLVRLRAGASQSGKKALAGALGAAGVRDLRVQAVVPRGQRILLFKSTTLTGKALVASALRNPNVIAASLNYRRSADAAPVYPDDPLFTDLWGLSNTGQTGGTPGADIGAPEAWSTTTGSAAAPACSRAPSAPRCRGPASRRDPRRTPGERSGGFRRFSFGSTLGADSRSTRERGV